MQMDEAVSAFLAGYFSTCKRSIKTQEAYRIDLGQLKMHLGAEAPLSGVGPDALECWATALQGTGYAAVSIRRKFATARVFFAYWVRKGELDKSPLWKIRLDLGREHVLPRSLTPADAKRFMEEAWRDAEVVACPAHSPADPGFLHLRNIAALEILFATGMRVGELVNLTLRDWGEDDQTFIVRGKGSRQRLAFLPDDRSFRAVQLYMTHRKAMNIGHEALFVNFAGKQISTQGISRVVAETASAAELTRKVTPHMIRHTVATLLLRYGADIRIVQEVLGHASIATTQRYTHVSKEHLFSALRARHPNHHLNIIWSAAPMEAPVK
jgi:site-specific recombinase XerD